MIRLATPSDAPIADIYAPMVADACVSFGRSPPQARWPRASARRWARSWLVLDRGGVSDTPTPRCTTRAPLSLVGGRGIHAEHRGAGSRDSSPGALRCCASGFARAWHPLPTGRAAGLRFRHVGVYPSSFKRGAWHDVSWWQLRWRREAPEPRHSTASDSPRGDACSKAARWTNASVGDEALKRRRWDHDAAILWRGTRRGEVILARFRLRRGRSTDWRSINPGGSMQRGSDRHGGHSAPALPRSNHLARSRNGNLQTAADCGLVSHLDLALEWGRRRWRRRRVETRPPRRTR